MPRRKYWKMSKARQTLEDEKERRGMTLSDGGPTQPTQPSVSVDMGVLFDENLSDGGPSQPTQPSVSFDMGVLNLSDGGLSQPTKPSVSIDMGVLNLSDGGLSQPTKPSVSEILPENLKTLKTLETLPENFIEPDAIDMGVLNLSDGGLSQPTKPSVSEILPDNLKTLKTLETLPENFIEPDADIVIDTLPETLPENLIEPPKISVKLPDVLPEPLNEPNTDIVIETFPETLLENLIKPLKINVNDHKLHKVIEVEQTPDTLIESLTDTESQPVSDTLSSTKLEAEDKSLFANSLESEKVNISQFKQLVIDISKLVENVSSNVQTDFDTVFLNTFPGVDADYHPRVVENMFDAEDIAACPKNAMLQQHTLHNNVTAEHHFNSGSSEPFLDNDVVCYQAVRSSEQLWNASDLVFGSFHQNDVRFSEQSRGYQCTCNALCMLSYSLCHDVDNSLILDEVLCEGDALYQTVIRRLKSSGKFVHQLLSLEEIPDYFEVKMGKFTCEKMPILSGPLIDTQNLGLPTLHDTLQSAFLSVSAGLLTIGAICSAVFRKNGMYVFFDSHSHGQNGLSSSDGSSCLITFSSINDLVTYMYAFYDSLNLDTSLQFDFLPIIVKKFENTESFKDQMDSNMEAYFHDQIMRQAYKAKRNIKIMSNNASKTTVEDSNKKKKCHTEYYKSYKQRCRQNSAFKANEIIYQRESKQSARKDPVFQRKERESKQSARKDPTFQRRERESKQSVRKDPLFKSRETMYQKISKQSARKDPVFQRIERESKQSVRKDPLFKSRETMYQKISKQSARKDPVFQRRERESKQSARKDPVFQRRERESKQSARKDPIYQRRERESKQSVRKDPLFKSRETMYQKISKQSARKDPVFQRRERESKQSARKDPVFQRRERESKQFARENQAFRAQEKQYQNASKKKARENPYVRECERIKKQHVRHEKRKMDDHSGMRIPKKKHKHDTALTRKTLKLLKRV